MHSKFTAVWETEKGKLEESHQTEIQRLKDKALALEREYTEMVELKNKEVVGLSESIEKSYSQKLKTLEEQIKNLLLQLTTSKEELNSKIQQIGKLEESHSVEKVNMIA